MSGWEKAERLVRRDATCGDQPPEREVPPDVGVAERLHGEDEDDDRGGADPGQAAGARRAALPISVGDHHELGGGHGVTAATLAGSLASWPQTLFTGYDAGCGGRCSDASLSVGTNATLSASWYTLVQPALWSITSASGVLTS